MYLILGINHNRYNIKKIYKNITYLNLTYVEQAP